MVFAIPTQQHIPENLPDTFDELNFAVVLNII